MLLQSGALEGKIAGRTEELAAEPAVLLGDQARRYGDGTAEKNHSAIPKGQGLHSDDPNIRNSTYTTLTLLRMTVPRKFPEYLCTKPKRSHLNTLPTNPNSLKERGLAIPP